MSDHTTSTEAPLSPIKESEVELTAGSFPREDLNSTSPVPGVEYGKAKYVEVDGRPYEWTPPPGAETRVYKKHAGRCRSHSAQDKGVRGAWDTGLTW
jgi:hypothetical protein